MSRNTDLVVRWEIIWAHNLLLLVELWVAGVLSCLWARCTSWCMKKMRKIAYLNSPSKMLGGSRSLRSLISNCVNSWHNSNTVPAYFSEFSRPVRYRLKCYPLIYFFKGLVLDELEIIFNWAVLFWIICWIWVVNSDVIWWDKNFGRLVYKSCTAICGDVGLIDRSMDLMTDCSFKYLGFYMAYTGRVVQLLSSI